MTIDSLPQQVIRLKLGRASRNYEIVGISSIRTVDESRALTSIALGPRTDLSYLVIDETEYGTLKEFGIPEWTIKQVIGTDPTIPDGSGWDE